MQLSEEAETISHLPSLAAIASTTLGHGLTGIANGLNTLLGGSKGSVRFATSKPASKAKSQNPLIRVRQALENPRFAWRTIAGIQRETGLSRVAIENALEALGPEIMKKQSSQPAQGSLYTTRNHYLKHERFWNRLLSTLDGRIR